VGGGANALGPLVDEEEPAATACIGVSGQGQYVGNASALW